VRPGHGPHGLTVEPRATSSPPATGIFGGTFDPVHYGHLRAALEARRHLGLEDFRLLPAGEPPHRPPAAATAEQRLEMLRLAATPETGFRVDDREVRRSGPSYMVDTLQEFRDESPEAPLVLIIGQDAANELDGWHRWRSLFELGHVAIMHRPGTDFAWSTALNREMEGRIETDNGRIAASPAGRVFILEITQLAISSTEIRRQVRCGESPRFLLPDAVIAYIRSRGLYAAS
jgi:nicotinate-nucleotide adenylyltransferase